MGGGDHGIAGGAAHVHLFTMIHAPLGLVTRSSIAVSMSIGGVSITIPSRLVAIAAAIASIAISTIPA